MSTLVVYSDDNDALPARGKFVQLQVAAAEVLLFAPKVLHEWHNQIVRHYLEDTDVAHQWFNPDRMEIDEDHVNVVGGGRFVVDAALKQLRLYSESQAYGRFDASGLARRINASDHPWSAFQIQID